MQAERSNSSREKWIESEAELPLTELACLALSERFALLNQYLSRATAHRTVAVDDIHQLRVSTRRAASALKVFGELASPRRVRRMQVILDRIRKAAGEARDLDVLYLRLAPHVVATPSRVSLRFLDYVLRLRDKAKRPLAETLARYDLDTLDHVTKRLINSIRWRSSDAEPTMAEAARAKLMPMISDLFVAANGDLADPKQLHALRIVGKRVRYALELFGGAFDAAARDEVYPIFIDFQDHLGLVNDYVTSQERLHIWQDCTKGSLKRFIQELAQDEHRRYLEQVQLFHDWWTPSRANELRDRFDRLLSQRDKSADKQGKRGHETRKSGWSDQYVGERRD